MTKCEFCGYSECVETFWDGEGYVTECDICRETTRVDREMMFCRYCSQSGRVVALKESEDGLYCEFCDKDDSKE